MPSIIDTAGSGLRPNTNASPQARLYYAATLNIPEGVTEALDAGADINGKDSGAGGLGATALMKSIKDRFDQTREVLKHHGYGNKDLSPELAANVSDIPAATQILIDRGADVNQADKCGRTPLMEATFHGACTTVALLLKSGADPLAKYSGGQELTARALATRGMQCMPHNEYVPGNREFRLEGYREVIGLLAAKERELTGKEPEPVTESVTWVSSPGIQRPLHFSTINSDGTVNSVGTVGYKFR